MRTQQRTRRARRVMTGVLGAAAVVASSIATAPAARASAFVAATWRMESPAVRPTTMRTAELVYFPPMRSVVLIDSTSDSPGFETWLWNGQNWVDLAPPNVPSNRDEASIAYHPATRKIVLFGGTNGGGMLNDTWTFDGITWTQESPLASPPVRGGAAFAHDPKSGGVLLFGGWCATVVCWNIGDLRDDTWLWNGVTWVQMTPVQSPTKRSNAVMSSNTVAGNVVLFGGTNFRMDFADTWTWNGSTWVAQTVGNRPAPQTRGSAAMTDAGTETLFVGAGHETWSWNGVTWTNLGQQQWYRDLLPGLAYDPLRAEAVLYEGFQTQTFRTHDAEIPVP